jgi:hypothetical protein
MASAKRLEFARFTFDTVETRWNVEISGFVPTPAKFATVFTVVVTKLLDKFVTSEVIFPGGTKALLNPIDVDTREAVEI